jgi:hypothetical protein
VINRPTDLFIVDILCICNFLYFVTIFVLSVQVIHLPKLGTRVCLNRGCEAFTKTNFTHLFVFLMYDAYVTTVCSLI